MDMLKDSKIESEEETATFSRMKSSSVVEQELSNIEPFDEEEFKQLDNKVKDGKATEEEEQEIAKLVPLMAKF